MEEGSSDRNNPQRDWVEMIGELYATMKGKGKGQGTWEEAGYGPWKGGKSKGK